MKYILVPLFLLIVICQISLGQSTVKELDQKYKHEIKGKLKLLRIGKGPQRVAVYYFKTNKKIYSIEKFEKTGEKSDFPEVYQFAYINDTLLRVYYFKLAKEKKKILAVLYLKDNTVLATHLKGNLPLPDVEILTQKSILYRNQGQEILKSIL